MSDLVFTVYPAAGTARARELRDVRFTTRAYASSVAEDAAVETGQPVTVEVGKITEDGVEYLESFVVTHNSTDHFDGALPADVSTTNLRPLDDRDRKALDAVFADMAALPSTVPDADQPMHITAQAVREKNQSAATFQPIGTFAASKFGGVDRGAQVPVVTVPPEGVSGAPSPRPDMYVLCYWICNPLSKNGGFWMGAADTDIETLRSVARSDAREHPAMFRIPGEVKP